MPTSRSTILRVAFLARFIRTVLAGCLLAFAANAETVVSEPLVARGIDYQAAGETAPADPDDAERPQLDIAFSEDEIRPLAVFVHGGGWRRGSRRSGRMMQDTLFSAGFSVASVDYRLWPDAEVTQSAIDIARAVQFLHDNASRFNLDPDRTALIGHSAGAHLAALVILHPDVPEASGLSREHIRSAVLLDGHGFDLMSYTANRPDLAAIFGTDLSERLAVSPVHLLDQSPPEHLPAFAIAWGDDRELTDTQSLSLLNALSASGADVTPLPYSMKSHREFLTDFRDPDSDLSRRVVSFLHATLD